MSYIYIYDISNLRVNNITPTLSVFSLVSRVSVRWNIQTKYLHSISTSLFCSATHPTTNYQNNMQFYVAPC
jgi:hypothetical protein